MDIISGFIEHIIFSNRDNGYTVFSLTTDTEEITCVGALHAVGVGESVRLTGEYVTHDLYGRQFAFSGYEVIRAGDEASILRYLSSGAVKYIGPSTAKKIVDAFGKDTFRIMEEEPEMLAGIKGISMKRAQEIGAIVTSMQDLRKVMIYLQKFGISASLANRIYARYGAEVYSVMDENPYRLAEDIEGVGFKTADDIALSAGIRADSPFRIRSGILYTLSLATGQGHIFLPKESLIGRATQILNADEEYVLLECENLAMEGKLIKKEVDGMTRFYPPAFYHMELLCARMLLDLDISVFPDTGRIREKIKSLEDPEVPLEERQRDAIVAAVSGGVTVITGGPGTGKTTIINVLIKYLVGSGDDFVLAAPTGRAAKRMSEATGYDSSTIQRLLGLAPSDSDKRAFSYEYNEDNPLEVDAIIVDEMSMVDLPLFRALLSAIVPGTRLIMVGDTFQLPSVGPGSVLKDMIASGCFNVVRLDRIFRQSEKSDIIVNAHRINDGIVPALDNKSRDFFMLERNEADTILKNIVDLVSQKLPKYVNAAPFDIQVLTPMRKGVLGVENLNPVLQRHLNPPDPGKREKEYGNVIFREGDKVMQIRNNYRLEWEVRTQHGIVADRGIGVFNGDMGVIDRIDELSEVCEVVYEDDHAVMYPFADLDELELAYAVTIHKSQGSEYPAVVIPLLTGPKPLFNRNLLYTAVTRARKCVVIVGSRDTVAHMTKNADELNRYSSLDEAITQIHLGKTEYK
ncbi:MAG: ATP-dependent RecD-like DNA helicase [Lachnospiraceae bacterium]|nr:ATP-dependent RecD-like DNA helicase [Lachnospiraceae bacterium]